MAESPFGTGAQFAKWGASFSREAPYRYGRIGLPLVAWLTALGRADWVPWTLVAINVIALAALPALAAAYLAGLGRDPRFAVLVLGVPGLWWVSAMPYSEPMSLALVLGAFVASQRDRRPLALALVAFAVLTRETAALAIVPLIWQDIRRHVPSWWQWLLALAPYLFWAGWVRVRVGEFPFFAHIQTRTEALRGPFLGIRDAWLDHGAPAKFAVLLSLITIAVTVAVGWRRRALLVGGASVVFGLFCVTLGVSTLKFPGETLRVLLAPHVFAVICVAYGLEAFAPLPSSNDANVDS